MLTMADLETVLADSGSTPVLVLKHSTTCPVSARAHREWEQFLTTADAAGINHAIVRVIEERPVSLALADRVGVAHQSPQAILIKGGRPVWNDSHRAITVDALKAAVARA